LLPDFFDDLFRLQPNIRHNRIGRFFEVGKLRR
jgi:hypothetical protein